MQSSSLDFKKKTPEGFVHFAKISGVFGIHGDAKVFLYNPNSDLMDKWLEVVLFDGTNIGERWTIRLRRGAGKKILAKIKDAQGQLFSRPEQLHRYMEQELLIAESSLPHLEDDEFYHHQLLGLPVHDFHGGYYGLVEEITSGTVDVFTIRNGKEFHYIPFIEDYVAEVRSDKILIYTDADFESAEDSEESSSDEN